MDKTSLGDRMKAYENIERRYLTARAPVIIRIDGVHFHTFTKGFDAPFDDSFLDCMRMTARDLCKNIEGAKLAYTQSDEISILLTDDDTIETQPWFGKNLQKIVSVSASMTSYFFNKNMKEIYNDGIKEANNWKYYFSKGMADAYAQNRMAIFDARAFVIPREEVNNYFEWRQQDAIRNSVQSVGQAYFSHKELDHKSCADIKEMLTEKRGVNWYTFPKMYKRGVCIIKYPHQIATPEGEWITRNKWGFDYEIPIFHENPNYIEDIVYHCKV